VLFYHTTRRCILAHVFTVTGVTSDLSYSPAGDNFIHAFLQAESRFSHSQHNVMPFIPSSKGISKGTSWIDLPTTFISVFAIKTRLQPTLFNEMALWRYKRGANGWAGLGVGRGERRYHLKYKMPMISSLYFIPSDVNKISVIRVTVVSL